MIHILELELTKFGNEHILNLLHWGDFTPIPLKGEQ